MFLRRLLVVAGPALLCLVTCILFRWMDMWFAEGSFFLYLLRGVLIGLCLALVLPIAGLSLRSTGLAGMLYFAALLMALLLSYQYLESVRAVSLPVLRALIAVNGQVLMVEGAVLGFTLLTAMLHPRD